ncbi:hypothetical protein BGZ76_007041 [Entomortierella beljakovae]|nr:hypothetical protein BGZ76_007041 [Entomortierella beljakovae]
MQKLKFDKAACLPRCKVGQDELRAKSQQGIQAVRSGVDSLRSVLANNPGEITSNKTNSENASTLESGGLGRSESRSTTTTAMSSSGTIETQKRSSTISTNTRSRSGSGSWSSFLPPSLSGIHFQNTSSSSSSGSFVTPPSQQLRAGSIKDVAGSISESVTESIKNLGSGLKLGQLADGFGLNGPIPGGVIYRRGTGDLSNTGHYLNTSGAQASRNRVWVWGVQDPGDASASPMEMHWSDVDSAVKMKIDDKRDILKTGAKTEEAARETAALLAKVREQQDLAMERAKRMPEVERMAQRYQDSWTEIHNHTTRNSEKADSADEILEKKLVGLEVMIGKLEIEAEEKSLSSWKKNKTDELDKYMETKRKELWDKAELLSTRSEQFQKEEAVRKLKLYQNQFETDMEKFRRIQQEKENELWKLAEVGDELPRSTITSDHTTRAKIAKAAVNVLVNKSGTNTAIPLATTDIVAARAAVLNERKDEERRVKEDLDNFLGPPSEGDSIGEEDEDEDEDDSDEDDNEIENTSSEEDEGGSSESDSEDDLDPIAKARKARELAAEKAHKLNQSNGATISAFSALSTNPSTFTLAKPL